MLTTDKRWLAQYPEEVPKTLEYENISLHECLERTATKFPNTEAIHFLGKKLTFEELHVQAKKCANQLISLGVKKGDRVAIMLANCPQSMISYYGALMAGAIVVQTNPLYVERELEHQMTDSGAKVMICLDLVFPRVQKVRSRTSLEHVIVTGIKDYLPFPKNLLYPFVQKKQNPTLTSIEYDEQTLEFLPWLKAGSENKVDVTLNPAEDLALIQYTGGTTGLAKGVMLTHRNLYVNTFQCKSWIYNVEEGKEKMLAALPFFHVYGMTVVMNLAVMNGFTSVLLPRFNVKDVLKTIDKQKVTLFPGAPTMYRAILLDPTKDNYDLSSIKACISGAAALPLDTQEKFEKVTGGKLVEGYGLTETAPVALANLIWGKRKSGSIGVPWPDTEVAIIKPDGEQADVKEVGEVAVRGPQVMKGYWNHPVETEKTFLGDWLLTGDMGYMDEEGFFYIVDRKKDMIIAGGFNIYPREIEEVLFEHEAVGDVAIIGVADEYRGETVKAFVVKKDGYNPTEKELDEHCRKHLAAYKVPRIYEFRDELPKTLIGKVLRRVLIEEEQNKMEKEKVEANREA
ncbi:long-chain fatty acid--CoA ligase [Alkalihalobacillus alcalophilus ATCC 27647 = CGMCC 1.3604]|uniref:Long-chain fatty acid--CoA ligase n=1 Tax=Alkalihalobacillus alcalophilus ATCC 27647 = CGMCC 1.3604 TaxID=1218173 RepID=A0A094YX86_ALKAL|nr:long-chain-fatty-acid--CoA ligase [Alkalihalobacillus alcalophilus]KGA98142.1 long-chain fatty acid--CoA ligase [Alkalihalobacillus alcalophilus ATCC 27647 = CGMCC 1.3604]MED1563558.1 long-chain-fatty-acid--CoA ligase [Alkalihalobacillus alcalophilus]THG90790.1 long-chain fatty acid--CoA ligase [Alkalihalobacillus alcalophilus ATCC 27647 = CGMCC 1.3604]